MSVITQKRFGTPWKPSIKGLVPGAVLLSMILFGVLAPISFSYGNHDQIGTKDIVLAELPVAMAAGDIISRDGKWYYGGNAYNSYLEATRARADDEDVYDPITVDVGNTSFQEGLPPETRAALGAVAPLPKSLKCEGLENLFMPTCWLRMLSVALGTLLISISAFVLAIADMLFNWAVDNTILLFQSAIFLKVEEGVNAGWTAMRDIANIVIIGMFTFIAISTILGIQEYGAKKLLARVLVIAVLINFSLLFTKIIIDASNFTASQFYASASGASSLGQARDDAATRSSGARSTITITEDNKSSIDPFRTLGIGGAFIRFLGVTSVSDTVRGLNDVADAGGEGGGWYVALAHGLLAAVLLGGAAGVLFYGAYLLISRAVLFIFLMITAAGAFATHLIPKIDDSKYGWSGWWSSLLHNAALAPILMILLWITLKVSASVTAVTTQNGGTLGNLASANASSTDIGSLFSYLIILGLLFGSFKLASKWAGKVGGLSLASMAITAPFNIGSRMAGFALRNTVGRGGALVEKSIGAEASRARMTLSKINPEKHPKLYAQVQEKANALEGRKRVAGWFAKQNYNPAGLAETSAGKLIAKQTGITSPVSAGDLKTNFADEAKKAAEAATARAEAAYILTRSDQEKMRLREQKKAWRQQKDLLIRQEAQARRTADASEQQARDEKARLQIEKQRITNQATADKAPHEARKVVAEEDLRTIIQEATARKATVELTSDVAIKGLQEQLRTATTAADKGAITAQIGSKVAERQALINQQDAKIKTAEQAVKNIENSIRTIGETAEKATKELDEHAKAFEENAARDGEKYKEAHQAVIDYDTKDKNESVAAANRKAREAVEKAIEAVKKPGAEAAERYATDMLSMALGRQTYKGAKAKTMYEDKQGKSRIKKDLETYFEEMSKPSGGTTPPIPPGSTGTTP